MSPDLIVVGAGPAGLAAAIAAARRGIDTLVLEARTLPHDKACGEGLLPNGVGALARLGIGSEDLADVSVPLVGIRYITPAGRVASSPFPDGAGLGVRRTCLSGALAARARREPTLEMRDGTSATVHWSAGGPLVTVGSETWRPRLVIGADGLQSRVRRACDIETRHGRRRRWGVRQHFSGEAWGDHVEVYFGPGFEAYVTPVDGGVNVAWLWEEGRVAPGADVHRQLVKHVALLEQRLDGRRPTDRAQAAGPFRHRPRTRVRDGVLLMGDAAGYLDPLTGEGVGLALMQAELFGEHVVPLIRDRSERVVSARACTSYLRAVDSASRPNHMLTRLMLSLSRRPAMVERTAAALAADPTLFRHLLAANIGRRSLWTAPLASICRLPFAMLAARPGAAADVRPPDGAGERGE